MQTVVPYARPVALALVVLAALAAASVAKAGDPYTCFRQFSTCKQACMSAPDYNACIAGCQSQYATCINN